MPKGQILKDVNTEKWKYWNVGRLKWKKIKILKGQNEERLKCWKVEAQGTI